MKNAAARDNMVTQQVRAWDVLSRDTLELMLSLSREDFTPKAYKNLSYADMQIPLGDGQVMLTPAEEGKMLQALDILPTETVLEIGTGSGYFTALLAKLANHVYSIDILGQMTELAHSNLGGFNFNNITLETGDASLGWVEHAPYDVIVITGSMPELPKDLAKQLNIDGRIFAILGDEPAMEATLFTKKSKDEWEVESLYETVVPRLVNVKEIEPFIF
jgi:protein-L-isoaspartate(D-aspartate) O-methyltransferase